MEDLDHRIGTKFLVTTLTCTELFPSLKENNEDRLLPLIQLDLEQSLFGARHPIFVANPISLAQIRRWSQFIVASQTSEVAKPALCYYSLELKMEAELFQLRLEAEELRRENAESKETVRQRGEMIWNHEIKIYEFNTKIYKLHEKVEIQGPLVTIRVAIRRR